MVMELALWTFMGVVKKNKIKDQGERTLSYFPALNLISTTVIAILRIAFYLSNIFYSRSSTILKTGLWLFSGSLVTNCV